MAKRFRLVHNSPWHHPLARVLWHRHGCPPFCDWDIKRDCVRHLMIGCPPHVSLPHVKSIPYQAGRGWNRSFCNRKETARHGNSQELRAPRTSIRIQRVILVPPLSEEPVNFYIKCRLVTLASWKKRLCRSGTIPPYYISHCCTPCQE